MRLAAARQALVETIQEELSEDIRWVGYAAAMAFAVFTLFGAYVFVQLGAVRPFLVFILVDGVPPPSCGFCVLFGH